MVVSTNILRDTIFFIKDYLDGEVTDPISSTRPSQEKFIMTSYPTRPTRFPLITIKDINSFDTRVSGLQSETMVHYIDIEIRIWAENVKDRDNIADAVWEKLRTNQIGISGTAQANGLHDFRLLSSVNVDEPNVKSKVMSVRYLFVEDKSDTDGGLDLLELA